MPFAEKHHTEQFVEELSEEHTLTNDVAKDFFDGVVFHARLYQSCFQTRWDSINQIPTRVFWFGLKPTLAEDLVPDLKVGGIARRIQDLLGSFNSLRHEGRGKCLNGFEIHQDAWILFYIEIETMSSNFQVLPTPLLSGPTTCAIAWSFEILPERLSTLPNPDRGESNRKLRRGASGSLLPRALARGRQFPTSRVSTLRFA